MTIAGAISLLTAIFKAIPTMEAWWESLVIAWIKYKNIQLKKETIQAIKEAIKDQDQRGLEDEEHSGKPSGIGSIRTSLPGVHQSKEN
jgi:hypothetical protein